MQILNNDQIHLDVRLWESFCKENGCENFVDLQDYMRVELGSRPANEVLRKYYFFDNIHLNSDGNELLFRAYTNHIKKN